ncbi:MAG: division/cell wall cluster transcriptional repressor MraZ [Pseudomonadales bacterium]
MFRGINSATLDSKGRMALPARFREIVMAASAGKVVVTIDIAERCLLLYPLGEWETLESKVEALSNVANRARHLQRLLIGHATDLELDANGRILLPQALRSYAGLDKKLTLVGQGRKVEIWNEERWGESVQDWLDQDMSALLADADEFNGLSL